MLFIPCWFGGSILIVHGAFSTQRFAQSLADTRLYLLHVTWFDVNDTVEEALKPLKVKNNNII
jgi:hypothetical protein